MTTELRAEYHLMFEMLISAINDGVFHCDDKLRDSRAAALSRIIDKL